MKRLPIFLIIVTMLCTLGCGNKHAYSQKEVTELIDENNNKSLFSEDSGASRDSEKPLLDFSTENEDSGFKLIEDNIFNYIRSHNIENPISPKKFYNLVDSLVHTIYDYNDPIENEWQLYSKRNTIITELRFLNYFLLKQINKKVSNTLSRLLYEENLLTDSLISSQHKFLKSHIDNACDKCDERHRDLKYYDVAQYIYHDRNNSLWELFLSLNNISHNPTIYKYLPDQLFHREYSHLQNLILCRTKSSKYVEYADRQTIQQMEQLWFKFIAKRDEISKYLTKAQREQWDNSTYRFQRSHLIALKNEFEEMGLLGPELASELVLPDTCTYEELFSYSNFTTKWNEYLKQFE